MEFMDPAHYKAAAKSVVQDPLFHDIDNHAKSCIFYRSAPSGNSLLHVAAKYGNKTIVELMASRFPLLISRQNNNGDTPFHLACAASSKVEKFHKLETLDTLLKFVRQEDGLLRIRNKKENTALHEALLSLLESTEKGSDDQHFLVSLACRLIQFDSKPCYYENKEGKSPLSLAVELNKMEVLDHILLSIDETTPPPEGMPPAHLAITDKKLDMLQKMKLVKPKLLDLKDTEGNTPLHQAAFEGYLEGLNLLLDYNSKALLDQNKEGLYPLHVACQQGHVAVIQRLLEPAWPDLTELLSEKGKNILHCAAEKGKAEAVEKAEAVDFLLDSLHNDTVKKLVNMMDEDGNTPLHLATLNDEALVVGRILFDNRAKSSLNNNDGLSPYDIAEKRYEAREGRNHRMMTLSILTFIRNWKIILTGRHSFFKNFIRVSNDLHEVSKRKQPTKEVVNDRINSLIVVATIIVAGAFGACHQMPADIQNPKHQRASNIYIIFDTLAMCFSLVATMLLCWAQVADLNVANFLVSASAPLVAIALDMMCVTFVAAMWIGAPEDKETVKIIANIVTYVGATVSFWISVPYILQQTVIRTVYLFLFCLYYSCFKFKMLFRKRKIGKLELD